MHVSSHMSKLSLGLGPEKDVPHVTNYLGVTLDIFKCECSHIRTNISITCVRNTRLTTSWVATPATLSNMMILTKMITLMTLLMVTIESTEDDDDKCNAMQMQ